MQPLTALPTQLAFSVGTKVNYDGIDTIITEGPRNICGLPCVRLQGISHHVTVMELRRQMVNPVQPKPMPEHNPDTIIMADGPHCRIHGWTPGASYATSPIHRRITGSRDANGLEIYVNSNMYNRLVPLGSNEYNLK